MSAITIAPDAAESIVRLCMRTSIPRIYLGETHPALDGISEGQWH
jgi:hypothetical protein